MAASTAFQSTACVCVAAVATSPDAESRVRRSVAGLQATIVAMTAIPARSVIGELVILSARGFGKGLSFRAEAAGRSRGIETVRHTRPSSGTIAIPRLATLARNDILQRMLQLCHSQSPLQ